MSTLAPLVFEDAAELALALNCLPDGGPPWSADLGDIAGDITALGVYAPGADPAHVAGLVGYYLRGPLAMAGEWLDDWADVDHDDFVVFAPDLTKSRRDDWAAVLTDPATGLAAVLASGSLVRLTDRAGAGTRGTRRWAGLPGGCLLVWR